MTGTRDFESSIADPAAPIAVDFDPGRNVLLLAFGGLAGQLGFPMFEFNRLTSGLKTANKIYLRDPHNSWYHRGLPGLADSIEGIVSLLRQYTTHESTKRCVVFGNSGGGYAALLFGHVLQVDEVHAFSPKTLIDPIKRLKLRDVPPPGFQMRDWWWLVRHGDRKYFDLKDTLAATPRGTGTFHVYYSARHRTDRLHATRLESISGIRMHSYPLAHHGLIRTLKKSGELGQIIERAMQQKSPPHF